MNTNLVHTILTAPWMMAPASAEAYLPAVLRLIQGQKVSFREGEVVKPYALTAASSRKVRYGQFNQAPEGSVAVYPMIGAITKYGGLCSYGTEDFMMMMSKADELKNIAAHMIEIDSGGGEGTNIESFARFIREEITKPVIAWFNGTCASAAYYIAAAADEVYASQATDMVGSIGVMVSFLDFRGFYEQQGIKLHEIYASQSSLKNKDFMMARDGQYEEIRSKLLNPFAAQFISDIKTYRSKLENADAFKGQIFTAKEGIAMSMIDGLKTYAQAVDRAIELSQNQTNYSDMIPIETALGYELEKQADGGFFLQPEEVAKINAKLAGSGEQIVKTDLLNTLQTRLTALETKVEELSNGQEALETSLDSKLDSNDFEAFKEAGGAKITSAFSQSNPDEKATKDAADLLEESAHKAGLEGGLIIG